MAILFVFSFSSCEKASTSSIPIAENTVKGVVEHKLSNTLHKGLDNIVETNNVFIKDGKSDYSIVCSGSSYEYKASIYISNQLGEATGVLLPIVKTADWSSDAKYIVVCNKELQTEANVSVTTEDIGITGYQIKTIDKSIFIIHISLH